MSARPADWVAAQAYKGRTVIKFFPPNPEANPPCEGGDYQGQVTDVGTDEEMLAGDPYEASAVYYEVRYSDGDVEDLSWEQLATILQPKPEQADGPVREPRSGDAAALRPEGPPAPADADTAPPTKRARVKQDISPSAAAAAMAPGEPGSVRAKPATAPGQGSHGSATGSRLSAGFDDERATAGRAGKRAAAAAAGQCEPAKEAGIGAGAVARALIKRGGTADGRSGGGDGGSGSGARASGSSPRAASDAPAAVQVAPDCGSRLRFRTAGLAGHVAKVVAVNFMSHENFEIDMGPHVTIISGLNGSGKSAIVQALQVCLGVKARDTGRNNSLSDFIRTGSDSARVAVTLWNTGTDAWEHDIFGDQLTIERRLTRSGSPFKVLDSQGRTRHTSGADVKTILDYLNVNGSNPLSIVTQDQSLTFFDGGSSAHKRKFELFMHATLQAKVAEEHTGTAAELVAQKAAWLTIQQHLQQLDAELQALRQRLAKLEDADKLEAALHEVVTAQTLLHRQDARVSAERGEREVVEVVPADRQRLAAALAGVEAALLNTAERLREKEETLQRQEADMGAHLARATELSAAFRAARSAAKEAHSTLKRSQAKLDGLQSDQKVLKDKYNIPRPGNERFEQQRQAYAQHAQLVKEKEGMVARLKTQSDQARAAWGVAKEQAAPALQQLEGAQRNLRLQQDKVVQFRQELQALQQGGADSSGRGQQSLARFGGPGVLRLAGLVADQRHRFTQPPIGPLGQYLGLKDLQWSLAVDNCMGGMLNLWLVNAYEDIAPMQDLARRAGCRNTSLFQSRFGLPLHCVQAPHNGHVSVLSVLSCLEPRYEAMIMNCLIDKAHVEDAVLVASEDAARNVTFNAAAGPHICRAYDLTGQVFRVSGGTKWAEAYSSRRVPRLGLDLSQQMDHLHHKISTEEGLVRENAAAVQGVQGDLEVVQGRVRDTQAKFQESSRQVKVAEQDLLRFQRATPVVEREGGVDEELEALNTQLHDVDVDVADSLAEVNGLLSALADEQRRQDETWAAMEEHKRVQAESERQRGDGTLDEEVDALIREKADGDAAAATAREGLAEVEARAVRLRQQAAAHRANEAACTAILGGVSQQGGAALLATVRRRVAGQVQVQLDKQLRAATADQLRNCSEAQQAEWKERQVQQHMSIEGLEKMEEQLKRQVAASDRNHHGVCKADVEHEVEVVEKKCLKKQLLMAAGRKVYVAYRASLQQRQAKYLTVRDNVLATVSAHFGWNLRRRNFDGYIKMDYSKEELVLTVQLPGTNLGVTDLNLLSGGEKSYVMCAYIMAVGAATESPFRCMDEYDVFMDAMNRRIATETMLDFAVEESHRQFVLLTPQDLGEVEAARLGVEKRKREAHPPLAVPHTFCKVVRVLPPRPSGGS